MTESTFDPLLVLTNSAIYLMKAGPKKLRSCLNGALGVEGDEDGFPEELKDVELVLSEILERFQDANDPVKISFRKRFLIWDNAESVDANWTGGTQKNTPERRERIYTKLDLDGPWRAELEVKFPIGIIEPPTTVYSGFPAWYTEDRKNEGAFYWPHYSKFLEESKGFSPENLMMLDQAASDTVSRLGDPLSDEGQKACGLVVGYVQSGKTANLTAVIAKAIDAGYRLIIVLAGRTDILRNQTQRRLDMELLGIDNLGEGEERNPPDDYKNDPAWTSSPSGFISFGARPHELGGVSIKRLTSAQEDFQTLKALNIVQPDLHNPELPVNSKENLDRMPARIIVVKKVGGRLKKLESEVEKLTALAKGIPALIIDDESDEASVNTVDPTKASKKVADGKVARTTINGYIVKIRAHLSRCQYVGYTATPFANALVNPEDYEGLFPRTFITCLSSPDQYMGVRSFCDLDDDLYPVGDFENLKKDETLLSVKDQLPLSNKYAFTRDVHHSDDDPYPKLLEALDSFVLSGAIKLFRQATGSTLVFRHHTMLIHESTRIDKHDELKSQVESLWNSGGYSGGIGVTRLRNLYHSDFELVTNARAGEEFQKVEFAKIKPYIGEVIARVEASGSPVITVSSDKSSEVPNFDTDSVWQILIGGMKLSRGYTVEGLTTSYFRRKPGATDTLMQAGRWFGYRPGYADLVRVYLGRSEPRSKKPTGKNPKVVAPRTVDLYECFEAACRDEELFRLELKRYSGQGLTPEQVPPLVYSSHAEMIPTARNKRWSSKLVFRNFGGEWIQKTLISDLSDTYGHNKDLVASLVEKRYSGSVGNETGDWENFDLKIGPKSNSFRSIWFEVSHQDMLDFLGSYKWATSKSGKDAASFNPMEVELEFLRGVKTDNEIFDTDPQIDSWIVLMPQVENDWTHVKIGNLTSSVIERVQITRDGPEAKFERPYKVLGEPRHRPVAEFIAGVRSKKIETGPPIEANTALELLGNGKRRGVMLLFFIGPRSDDENYDKTVPRSVGFELLPPDNSARKTLGYVAVSNPAPGSVINSNS